MEDLEEKVEDNPNSSSSRFLFYTALSLGAGFAFVYSGLELESERLFWTGMGISLISGNYGGRRLYDNQIRPYFFGD